MLIGARVLLALGGSMIMPCVLGIIRRTFEDEGEILEASTTRA
jgi:DHA2 family multidrug resistance protein-like MFS transporter